ncbi:MAG: MFS transporter [Firmicutes bacterium]|nr:MFS transporter [Bacillota bacterium]
MKDRLSLWNREFLSLNLFILLVFFNLSFFVLLPIYLKEIGGSSTVIGVIMGLYALANFVTKPMMGGLMHRFGYKSIIVTGALIVMAASILYGVVEEIGPLIFAVRIIHGFGVSLAIIASLAILGRMVAPEQLGQGYNMAALCMVLPMSFAPMLGEWVLRSWGFPAFWPLPQVAMALAMVSLVLAWPAIPGRRAPSGVRGARWLDSEVFRDRVMMVAVAVTFLAFVGQGSMNNLIALYTEDKGLNSGYYFGSCALAIVFLRMFLGRYFDRDLQRPIIAWALLVWVAGCCTLPLVNSNLALGAAGLVIGAGFFPIYPVIMSIVIKRSTPEHSDNNLSLFNAATDLGFLVGPALFGLVIKSLGYLWFFIGAAVIVLIARLVWGAVGEVSRRQSLRDE